MNAVAQPLDPVEARFEAMTPAWLPTVARVEKSAYAYPWNERNFLESLQAGYHAQLLVAGRPLGATLLGYFVALKGVDEVHLLNLTVAPAYQRHGWARVMLDALGAWARWQGAQWLWLEVRVSNARAKSVYEAHGFHAVGMRRGYYPATLAAPVREDALVMSLAL